MIPFPENEDEKQDAYDASYRVPTEPITEEEWEASIRQIEAMGIEVER